MKPATYRIELYKGKKLKLDEDRHPVCLTVTFKGKVKRKTIASALPKEWDSKNDLIKPRSRKDWELINYNIETEYTKYLAAFNALKQDLEAFTVERVFEEKKILSPLFKYNALEYLEEVKHRCSQLYYETSNSRYKKILRYTNEQDFRLSEIDERWAMRYRAYCRKLGNVDNTANGNLKFLISVANHAGANIKLRLTYDKTFKEKLTAEEIIKFNNVASTPNTLEWHAKNTWMLQFYLRGMRIGDVLLLQKKFFIDDRLVYQTSKNEKDFSIKLIEPCLEIIDLYSKSPGKYLLPWIRTESDDKEKIAREIKNRTMVINSHLKEITKKAGINKKISTHIARHSFAAMADKKTSGNIKVIQDLLGHGSRKMTEIYLNDLRKTDELDDAADLIFG